MEIESGGDAVDGLYVECYPSWNKHLLPVLKSLFPQPSEVEILVPACGESEMSLKLYDAGYEHITNIDSSRDVIRKMLKRHVNQPNLLWRLGDITEKFGSKPHYDIVIDKGALDGLTSSEDSYLKKVKSALKLGGKFICFTHFNGRAKALLLEVFSMGFRTTFHDLPEDNPATMMVTERVNFLLPYLLSVHDDKQVQATNPLLYQAISDENAKRQRVLDDMSFSLAEIESGVMGDPNVISIGRSFMVDWTGEASLKYEVLVLDVKPPRHCFSWDIFFVRKLTSRLLDLSEPERLMICSHAQASRVYVVLLLEFEELLPTDELLRNFDMLFSKLAPQGSGDTVRCTKISEDQLLSVLEEEDRLEEDSSKKIEAEASIDVLEFSEDYVSSSLCLGSTPSPPLVEPPPLQGYLWSKYPHSADSVQFPICGISSEPHCTCYGINLFSHGQFILESNNIASKRILVDEEYDLNLTKWLSENPYRWSVEYEEWNSLSLRTTCRVNEVQGWNSSRPLEECGHVISGLIAAVCDYHSRGKIHGDLINTDCYLMRYKKHSVGGLTQNYVYVRLHHPTACKGKRVSVSNDMMDLSVLIFKIILEDRKLPNLWQDLRSMMLSLESFPHLLYKNKRIIQNHPSCWDWHRRYHYFQCLWMRIHEKDKSNVQKKIKDAFKSVEMDDSLCWKDRVPIDTPLYRVMLNNSYTEDVFDQCRFLRVVSLHIYDGKKYFTHESEDNAFRKSKFVEVVMTECFPEFLLKIFKTLERESHR